VVREDADFDIEVAGAGVPVLVGVTVSVKVLVTVGVNVGDQHRTSALTQFEKISLPPFISAWFDTEPHVVALAHHVKEPDWNEVLGSVHLGAPPDNEQPLQPK
jgi:hypothetical protein